MNSSKITNIVFISHLAFFALVVTGLLSRGLVPYETALLALWFILAPLEEGTAIFVRSIPLFIAIPLTSGFDNFNQWRVFSIILFLKWFWRYRLSLSGPFEPRQDEEVRKSQQAFRGVPCGSIGIALSLLLIFALLSLIPAIDKFLAVKRIIYFVNLSLISFIIHDMARKMDFAKHIIKNMAPLVIIVTVAGFFQLLSTYFMDIYQFMGFWGGKVQFNQFGADWSYIAYNLGNTWFAYYGEQISLRMFSLFPDSHSFPQFVLLGLPAILAFRLRPWLTVPAVFLAAVLSGTRGIWAASIGAIMSAGTIIWLLKKWAVEASRQRLFLRLSAWLLVFFLLIGAAFPIFASPQFKLYKLDRDLLGKRIVSIINFGETSNKERLRIYRLTLKSIAKRPFLGVGIGNFPIVLDQDLVLARAGSSAHNLYLQIAAEMGLPALLATLWLLWLILRRTYLGFVRATDTRLATYFGSLLLFLPWILIYGLTDVALFDERMFLLFVTTVGLITSASHD